MAILEGHKANLHTLFMAHENGDIALMECTDKATGKPVIVICAVNRDGGDVIMAPLAKLFDGNPYEELDPPAMRPEYDH